MNEIMVSVCCIVYNHEKYLRKCLDGFIMQKCNFKYEVIIHDDASTDSSPEIIREYCEKYPDIFVPILQTENQYSKGVRIGCTYIYPKVRGKYVALCEGDDYWTDPNKLQKQFDALEQYPDCHICLHRVDFVSEDDKLIGRGLPLKCKNGKNSGEDLIKRIAKFSYPFNTTSYFMLAKDIKQYAEDTPAFAMVQGSGDVPLLLFFSTKENYYYIDEVMSHYRAGSVGSWSERMQSRSTAEKDHADKLYQDRMNLFDEYTDGKYNRYCKIALKNRRYKRALMDNDYKELIKLEYRKFLKQNSLKAQIKIYLYAFMPRTLKLYDDRKNK